MVRQHSQQDVAFDNDQTLPGQNASDFVRPPKSMAMVQTHNAMVPLSITLVALFMVVMFCLTIVPWQQSVPGKGKITVFSPMSRPQLVQTQIDGQVKKWHVLEGDTVQAGDLLVELVEVNTSFLDSEQVSRLKSQKEALLAKRQAVETGINALQSQVGTLAGLSGVAVPSAGVKVQQAKNQLAAAKQNVETATLNLKRLEELYEKGLRSKRDLELARLDFANATAEKAIAQQQSDIASFDQNQVGMEVQVKVQDASTKLAKNQENLAGIDAELLTLDIQIASLERRVEQRQIKVPIAGQLVRAAVLGAGETVKAGDTVAVIAPKTTDQAVELYVSDFNVPLLSVGRPVRLQFSGWPAIQFSGWPSIAVGTFGGRVAVIDAIDNGKNQYRILVRPDVNAIKEGRDQPWPKYPYLRPGTQVNGWVMLDTVPLGFELWRQFNGFPPAVEEPDAFEKAASAGAVRK